MARFQGPKAGTGALVIGAVVAALVAAGIYFAFRQAPQPEQPGGGGNQAALVNGASDANAATDANAAANGAMGVPGGGNSSGPTTGGGGNGGETGNSAIPGADATAAPGAELTPLPSATVASTPLTSASAQPTTGSASLTPSALATPRIGGPSAAATPPTPGISAIPQPTRAGLTENPGTSVRSTSQPITLPTISSTPSATAQPGY